MKKIILLVLAVTASNFYAQVGMGTTQPHASSVLELSSTTQGFLLPRMTNEQLKEIENPAEALMVYNTDLDCVMIHVEGSYNCIQNPVATTPVATSDLGGSAAFDNHYNGWVAGLYSVGGASDTATSHTAGEAFSANTDCTNKQISISACNGATVTGKSGIQYRTIDINGQCWMQDNLQEVPSNFANFDGTYTASAGTLGHWGFWSAPSGSYGATVSSATPNAGFIYTWNAAMDNATAERSRGVCPQGFHIPSDCEVMFLEHGLGMNLIDQLRTTTGRGVGSADGNVIAKLEDPAVLNFFNVGHLDANNNFGIQNNHSMWTSTEGVTNEAFMRYHRQSGTLGLRRDDPKNNAFSVRCLKD